MQLRDRPQQLEHTVQKPDICLSSALLFLCMGLWDKGAHMTMAEWLATCKRIQGRLNNLKVDPVAVSPAPKSQRSARSRAGSSWRGDPV